MSQFLFLFKGGDPQSRQLSPEELQKHMGKWTVWMQSLTERGYMRGGLPLEKGGKIVKGSERLITDGPFPESKDLVGGYILIEAKDIDEAAKIARECPLFEDTQNLNATNAPSVEVRPAMNLGM